MSFHVPRVTHCGTTGWCDVCQIACGYTACWFDKADTTALQITDTFSSLGHTGCGFSCLIAVSNQGLLRDRPAYKPQGQATHLREIFKHYCTLADIVLKKARLELPVNALELPVNAIKSV